ncbi:MAG: hydrogenase nickel incorporation protein HypB [Bacteroidales bacterium]|nr:hydrogenase nickel incorporation protein HypB [Bacteroidales bacterium]
MENGHSHGHSHGHGHGHSTSIAIDMPVMGKNNLLAERNRGYFEAKNIKTFNLVSSPGSGKTTLLEKIIELAGKTYKIYVIEGDQQTTNDAQRIEKAGAIAIQINTGNGCHLDAEMVNAALKELNPSENSLVFIENVGNLVCPALFDLGESMRILVASVTEGDDKPLKYPGMFESSQICIINKTDLLPYVNFDVGRFKENALHINHHLIFFETSASSGKGIKALISSIVQ